MKNDMTWSSFFVGLSRIQIWRIIFSWFCWVTFFPQHRSEAKCQVTTKQGQDMILTMGPFPQGIHYDQNDDRFICESPGSCQGYHIAGCGSVRCEQEQACAGTQFSHIYYLRCRGYDSCTDVTVRDTDMMHCGSLQTTTKAIPDDAVFKSSCERAKIHIKDKFLNCIGAGSCYAPLSKDRMVVNVGSNATVACGSSTVHQKACGNMVIEVSHGKRACYATDWYQTCALYCEKPEDCDRAAIQFRVVGPSP